jgi:hypothetical protein
MKNNSISDGAWVQGAVVSILINSQTIKAYVKIGE